MEYQQRKTVTGYDAKNIEKKLPPVA